MEDETSEEKKSCHWVENQGDGDGERAINSTLVNKEYEIVTAISDNFSCETIKSETAENDRQDSTDNLESFHEHPEALDSKWIENVQKDTSALERWQKYTTNACQNMKGQAFAQCPLFRPHENLPSENHDGNANFDNQHFTLETSLSRISKMIKRSSLQGSRVDTEQKFHPEWKNKTSYVHGVPPDVALENYCQQHAYSRARLLRTDRRTLANELLETLDLNSDETEILVTHSPGCSLTPISETSQISPQPVNMRVVEEAQGSTSHKTYFDSKDTDYKQSHLNLSTFSGRTANASARLNKEYEQRKETGSRAPKTIWKKPLADEIYEPFKITPCLLFPSQVSPESRNRILRRKSSVPRCIPRLTN